jgi:hypothetical protein
VEEGLGNKGSTKYGHLNTPRKTPVKTKISQSPPFGQAMQPRYLTFVQSDENTERPHKVPKVA